MIEQNLQEQVRLLAEQNERLREALRLICKSLPQLPEDEDWTCVICDGNGNTECEINDCPRSIAHAALAEPTPAAVERLRQERELDKAARELAEAYQALRDSRDDEDFNLDLRMRTVAAANEASVRFVTLCDQLGKEKA